jgi:glycosyltransferase involved in cell wall biosynthesis
MAASRSAIAPDWYAAALGSPFESIDARLDDGPVARASARVPLLRGVRTFIASRAADRVALVKGAPGTATFLVLESVLGPRRRRTVLLEFLPRALARRRLTRTLGAVRLALDRALVRRAMLAGHALTAGERAEYAHLYGLPEERFVLIPWAFRRDDSEPPSFRPESRGVLASGRGGTDWETLFAAARGAGWELTVACTATDLRRVRHLNQGVGAEVLCDVSRHEHDERLRAAAVYAIALTGARPSAGHVRLMAAVGAGTAVVTTLSPSLEGYVVDGETASVVPARDPASMRRAVDALLDDPEERKRLRSNAWRRATGWTYADYFDAIRSLVLETG